ncbi:hypothetical protein [Microbacterium sp. KNMS]
MKRNAFGQLIYSPFLRFAVEGGEGGGGGDGAGGNAGDDGFKPPASQEELDRIIAQRVARAERNAREDERRKLAPKPEDKPAGKDDDKGGEKPAGVSGDDVDKRIADALAAKDLELALERVSDRLDKALEGRAFSASKLFALDRSQFVKDDGKTVDDTKIADWVKANSTEPAAPSRRLRAQGERGSDVVGGSVSAGRDLYDEIHKKKSGKD